MTVTPSPNRCYQTSSSTGTGTLNLDGSPPAGMHSFVDGFGSGKSGGFIALDGSGNVEINVGVATAGSPDTLSRGANPIWSTNIVAGAYARVNFPAGPITVFTAPIFELMVMFSAVQTLSDGMIPFRKTVSGTPQWVADTIAAAGGVDLASAQIVTGAKTFAQSVSNNYAAVFENSSSVPYIIELFNNGVSTPPGGYFIVALDNGSNRFLVESTGNVTNKNNSYGAISDRKLKTDIEPARSQWDDVKRLGALVRRYRLKDDAEGGTQIGLIADEAKQISPGLVRTSKDFRRVTKSSDDKNAPAEVSSVEETGENTDHIVYSVLHVKALKALSEAMERIEAIEARLTALEAKGAA